MAQQLQANVYQIEGMPQNGAFPMSFPTDNIMMRGATLATISEVNSEINYYPNQKNPTFKQSFLVSESLSSLLSTANTSGTSQVRASIYAINGNPIANADYCFPASCISIWPHIDGNVHSFILFKSDKYYAGETRDALVAAANTGGGGGSGVLTASATLTDAQIKALSPDSTFELVAAPGVDKMLLVMFAVVRLKMASGAYTNVDANAMLFIGYGDGATAYTDYASNMTSMIGSNSVRTSILTSAISAYPLTGNGDIMPTYFNNFVEADFNNTSLVLVLDNKSSGFLTGGNAANTMEVTVFYSIVDL